VTDISVIRALHATFEGLPDAVFDELEASAELTEQAPQKTREIRSLWLIASGLADPRVMAKLSIAFNRLGLMIAPNLRT